MKPNLKRKYRAHKVRSLIKPDCSVITSNRQKTIFVVLPLPPNRIHMSEKNFAKEEQQ